MSTNERDTHFANFARLLEEEISNQLDVYFDSPSATEEQIRDATRLCIARRAYDFAVHVADEVRDPLYNDLDTLIQQQVADMTSFPKD